MKANDWTRLKRKVHFKVGGFVGSWFMNMKNTTESN